MLSRNFIKVVLNHLKYLSVITTGPKLLNKNLKVEYLRAGSKLHKDKNARGV